MSKLSKESVYAQARLLSINEKAEVVVFQDDNGHYGYSLLDEYTGSVLNILTTLSDGFILE